MWDDSITEIHGVDTGNTGMTALLRREPRTVVQWLRYVVGARKYQSDCEIADSRYLRSYEESHSRQARPARPVIACQSSTGFYCVGSINR